MFNTFEDQRRELEAQVTQHMLIASLTARIALIEKELFSIVKDRTGQYKKMVKAMHKEMKRKFMQEAEIKENDPLVATIDDYIKLLELAVDEIDKSIDEYEEGTE